MLAAVSSEETPVLVDALATHLPASGLQQVKYISVDNPSAKLWNHARQICPNLQILALDPVHLAMTCEYASSRRRTASSKILRAILQKFSAYSSTCSPNSWGPVFTGGKFRPLSREEEQARLQIEDRSMRMNIAEKILSELDASIPFFERIEWIRSLAALVAVHRGEVERVVPGPNRKMFELLHTAAAGPRTEWYLNNLRMRHAISQSRLSLLPVGTTSNEALHREINNWFRETQQMHKTTLELKLSIMSLGKLMTHNTALYWTTTRQMPEAEVLARTASVALWSPQQWSRWCEELVDGRKTEKATLRLHPRKQAERSAVRAKLNKKPAASHGKARKRRITPNTLLREDNLRRAGVRGRKPVS